MGDEDRISVEVDVDIDIEVLPLPEEKEVVEVTVPEEVVVEEEEITQIPVEVEPEIVEEPKPVEELKPDTVDEAKPIEEPKPAVKPPAEEVVSAVDTEPVAAIEEVVEDKLIPFEDILMPGPVIFEPEIEKESPVENIAPTSPDNLDFDKLLEERLKEVEESNYDQLVAEEVEKATSEMNAELDRLRE